MIVLDGSTRRLPLWGGIAKQRERERGVRLPGEIRRLAASHDEGLRRRQELRVNGACQLPHRPATHPAGPPFATQTFERLYKGRTAIERVNGRQKVFGGADDGNDFGSRRFPAQIGTVMNVHVAFATLLAAARRNGTLGKMYLTLLAKALRKKPHALRPLTTQPLRSRRPSDSARRRRESPSAVRSYPPTHVSRQRLPGLISAYSENRNGSGVTS